MRQADGESGAAVWLLTKYNAAIPGRPADAGLDAGWLAGRLRLFCDWCLPSVRAQQRRPDRWLLFVDARTPAAAATALADRIAGLGELVPVAGPLTDAGVRELAAARLAGPVGTLVSARLDSDDALAASYLARVEAAAGSWRGFVHAPLGYRWSDGGVLRCREASGPFLSFVEAPEGRPRTVFQAPHGEAARHGPVRQLPGRPAWLQVIHGGNLANGFGGWPADPARLAADLGLPGLPVGARPGGVRLAVAAGRQLRQDLAWHARRFGAGRARTP